MGTPTRISVGASVDLNLIRGLAALVVAVGHLRGVCFWEYDRLVNPPAVWKAIYFATGLGHQAVMVFFVLSGFLISASFLSLMRNGWSWRIYLVNRVTRLYVVLFPALVVTLAADQIGMAVSTHSSELYSKAIPNFGARIIDQNHSPMIFLGNAVFLQTIFVPSFGSNGPLWSLANEFWYYIVFPLLALPWFRQIPGRQRILGVLGAAALIWFLPQGIVALFPVWLFGVALHWIPRWQPLARNGWAFRCALVMSIGVFLIVLAVSRYRPGGLLVDYVIGISCGLLIYVISHRRGEAVTGYGYRPVADTLSGFSYSLYAVHFPLIVLSRAILTPAERWEPGMGSGLMAAAVLAGVMLVCYGFSLATEARTSQLRRWALRRL